MNNTLRKTFKSVKQKKKKITKKNTARALFNTWKVGEVEENGLDLNVYPYATIIASEQKQQKRAKFDNSCFKNP